VSFVTHAVEDGVATVELRDPDRRNALTKELSDDLAAAVTAVVDQGASALVLTAAPPVFCSGGLLDDLIAPRAPLHAAYAGLDALTGAPIPTIAVVTGGAIGAGVNLPLGCDVIIAGRSARFDPRFLDVGIHPGGGHLWRLRQRVGHQGAAALVLCGDALTGEEAERSGLAWRCVDDDDALPLAHKFARRVASRDRELIVRAKATLVASAALDDPTSAAALELETQQWSVDRPGFVDGVQRVKDALAKRKS
jgi:enoyl-CoA hydratase